MLTFEVRRFEDKDAEEVSALIATALRDTRITVRQRPLQLKMMKHKKEN